MPTMANFHKLDGMDQNSGPIFRRLCQCGTIEYTRLCQFATQWILRVTIGPNTISCYDFRRIARCYADRRYVPFRRFRSFYVLYVVRLSVRLWPSDVCFFTLRLFHSWSA